MKRILIICCIAGLFSACSDFLKEYSQDLAKVESSKNIQRKKKQQYLLMVKSTVSLSLTARQSVSV